MKKYSFRWAAVVASIVLLGAGCSSLSKLETTTPSTDQTQTPVTQTPVTQTPVTQTPVTQTPVTQTPVTQTPVTQTPVTTDKGGISMDVVAKHNSVSSCYTVVNGSVYDVTDWINQHPGGSAAIKSMCGKDASNAFDSQHGGQRRPESELASFKIGVLAQ